jgi:phosphate/sulfate permease
MLAAETGAMIWLLLATYLELPVSTTHSIVGGIIGFALAYGGGSAVNW